MSLLTFVTALGHLTEAPAAARNVQSIAGVDDVFENEGTAFNDVDLPATVQVTFTNGAVEAVPVEWGSIDYSPEVGRYVLTGELDLSGSDTNLGNLTAQVTVFVDSPAVAVTNWLPFNGYLNYIKFGDYLDSLWAANDVSWKVRFRIRNYSLSDTCRLLGKLFATGNQRSWAFTKAAASLSMIWYRLGTSTEIRGVTFANCLTDTNEHLIEFRYDGSIDTNNGLDRVKLFIDSVEVTAGKSLSSNGGTLGQIFNSTARLAFGVDVASDGSTATSSWFFGEMKDLQVLSVGDVVELHGIDCPIADPETGTYVQHAQPVLNGSKNASAQDAGQCTFNSIVDTGTHWYLYYLGANPAINSDRDETCLAIKEKSNDITTGWVKHESAGVPVVVYGVGAVGKFDAKQVWLRNVRKKLDGTYEAWPMGQSAVDAFAIGYSTSADGITWTRQNSGDPVYNDGTLGITCYHIVWDEVNSENVMIYAGQLLGESINVATSPDGLTWTKVHFNILFGEALGWPMGLYLKDGVFYIWAARKITMPSGICETMVLYTTEDWVNFEFHGVQDERHGASDNGMTATIGLITKPNGEFSILRTSYKNQINKSANLGEEFTCIKALDLNRIDIPIAGRPRVVQYPDYVIEHYPLNRESNLGLNILEAVSGEFATINSTAVYTQDATYGNRTLGFIDLSGSQNITRATTLPAGFNPANFGIKLRVEIVTTGTHTLFQIGDSSSNRGILITLESGKMRVRLSADGTNWTKDWIRTVNLAKPTGMNYIDNHIYLAVHFASSTLTLYNDFELVDAANITETVDGAVASMHYTNGSRVIGENATLEMRSVSICSPVTAQELIDLEI